MVKLNFNSVDLLKKNVFLNFFRKNSSGRAAADFWENKNLWLDGWNLGVNDDSHLQVDYVRVWAL